MEIVIGTKNKGKVREFVELLADFPIVIKSLDVFPEIIEPEETGSTFAENAILKARAYARHTGCWSLADDSGLEVEALGGAPGIFSARYAGADATDGERITKLLRELDATGDENRLAQFVCAMAVSDEKGEIKFFAEGICPGTIIHTSRGTNGFGYDPVFMPEGFSETFGELSNEIKGRISHRAHATNKIIAYLRDFIAVST